MTSWLEARAWQIGAIGGGVVAVGLALALAGTTFQKVGLERDLADAQRELVQVQSDLRTCRGNTTILESTIASRNAEIARISAAGEQKIRDAEIALAGARGETARLTTKINQLLTTPAVGATACERVDAVDRAVQEAFR